MAICNVGAVAWLGMARQHFIEREIPPGDDYSLNLTLMRLDGV